MNPVTNHQVIPFADPACSVCHGAGWFHVHAPPGDSLCGCAVKRFAKAHRGRICQTSEGAFWQPGMSPEEMVPDRYADLGARAG